MSGDGKWGPEQKVRGNDEDRRGQETFAKWGQDGKKGNAERV